MKTKLISFSLQLLLWFLFLGLPFINNPEHFNHSGAVWAFAKRHSLYVIFFYLNYFYFIPKTLKKKGLKTYLVSVLVTMLVVFFAAHLAEGWFINRGISLHMFMGFVPIIQVYAVSTTFRLVLDYIHQLTTQKELEAHHRFAEVNFLRSQINPHFLFNTLNNINALIRLRPAEAEKSIGSLSDLMRYMLNTSKLEKAELGKEMAYIRNYIDLQTLRLAKGFNLKFEMDIKDETVLIEPLLLIGFIENTFKHGVSGADDDFIEIKVSSDAKQLELIARNRIHKTLYINEIASGIGLENTKKRLQLCYPGKYSVELQTDKGIYDIRLKLNL